jgi:hypothetical protein
MIIDEDCMEVILVFTIPRNIWHHLYRNRHMYIHVDMCIGKRDNHSHYFRNEDVELSALAIRSLEEEG